VPVSAQETVFRHIGNGITVSFPFGCQVLQASDLKVYINDAEVTSGFTVAGIGVPTGGTVTFDVPPSGLAQVRLERDIVLERLTDYQQNGDFLARVVNPDFNRLWMALQQHLGILRRALVVPKSDLSEPAPLPKIADRANKLLSFDELGNPIAVAPAAQSATAALIELASAAGSALIGYIHSGIGAVKRSLQEKLRDTIHVKDYGAKGDGVTDDTLAIEAAGKALKSGQTLHLGDGTYLISYKGAAYSSVYGNAVIDLLNKTDISILGEGATIKVVNHDITAKGGLRFANFKGCKRVRISGINFDMTFLGSNTSGQFYPFCGAITALDEDAPAPDFNGLNSDFTIDGCSFKLYHPAGNWQTTANPYLGDGNNGFKLFSIFVSGPFTPTEYDNQCRNVVVDNCTWRKGHNGYGIWFWAWNNCRVTSCVVEDWVAKYSDNTGSFAGGGVAWVRHIPFRTAGMVVSGNQFRAKPTSERIGAFAGKAQFYVQANNIGAANLAKGETVVSGNNIIMGAGGQGLGDEVLFFNTFGTLIVSGNTIDGHEGTVTTDGGSLVLNYSPGDTGGQGESSLIFTDNTIGTAYLGSGILFVNGSNESEANRRCKHLVVTGNTMARGDFFLRMTSYAYKTYEGVRYAIIADNVIDMNGGALFPPPSGNNYGIHTASLATDIIVISGNAFANTTEAIKSPAYANSASANIRIWGNSYKNITTPYNAAANLFPAEKFDSAPVVSAVGSDTTVQPYVSARNTTGNSEVKLFQQSTTSYLMATNQLEVYAGGASQLNLGANYLRPTADNTKTLGQAATRWSTVYAGTGAINTSDERAKQQVQTIDVRVLRAWAKVGYAQYKFNDAVEAKGDGARWHIGVIAQRVKEAFESEGLDAFSFGLLCYDEWDDQHASALGEDGNPTAEEILVQPAGNRYGIRYEEALALECAYLRSRLTA